MTKLMCVILVILLAGCSEVTPMTLVTSDAGDAGAPPGDGGPWHEDAQGDAGDSGPDARVLILPDADGGVTEADGGPDAGEEPDAGPLDAGEEPDAATDPDGGEPPREDGAVPEADAGSDAGAPDAGPPDAGPTCGTGIRPRPVPTYVGAPLGCPAPSGPLQAAWAANGVLAPIMVEDRWSDSCTPGAVFIHSVPTSIVDWCRSEAEAATTCTQLAYAVADCRACASAWVDYVVDTGCPLDAPSPSSDWVTECSALSATACGHCLTSCPYAGNPTVAVGAWCQSWMAGATSCLDANISAQECATCYALGRELARP